METELKKKMNRWGSTLLLKIFRKLKSYQHGAIVIIYSMSIKYANSDGDGSTFKRPSPQDPNGNEKTPLQDFMAISIADSDSLDASELLIDLLIGHN